MKVKSEEPVEYKVDRSQQDSDDQTITKALNILYGRLTQKGEAMDSPKTVRDFLQLKMADLEHEVFACMFLDTQHRLIAHEELFRGTLTQASVYPREVVKSALAHNAASVIFAHNHPSGMCEPSRSDELLTSRLKEALAIVDVRALDHFIVGAYGAPTSFAERGLI